MIVSVREMTSVCPPCQEQEDAGFVPGSFVALSSFLHHHHRKSHEESLVVRHLVLPVELETGARGPRVGV